MRFTENRTPARMGIPRGRFMPASRVCLIKHTIESQVTFQRIAHHIERVEPSLRKIRFWSMIGFWPTLFDVSPHPLSPPDRHGSSSSESTRIQGDVCCIYLWEGVRGGKFNFNRYSRTCIVPTGPASILNTQTPPVLPTPFARREPSLAPADANALAANTAVGA